MNQELSIFKIQVIFKVLWVDLEPYYFQFAIILFLLLIYFLIYRLTLKAFVSLKHAFVFGYCFTLKAAFSLKHACLLDLRSNFEAFVSLLHACLLDLLSTFKVVVYLKTTDFFRQWSPLYFYWGFIAFLLIF